MDAHNLQVINNTAVYPSRFEIQLDERLALLEYFVIGDQYVLTHTEVPPDYGGQGIGDFLVKTVLEQIRAEGRQLRAQPMCPFVKKYLQRHTDYQDLVVS